MEQIVCPKCHSDQITAGKKGFNNTNAALGFLSGGAAMGIGMGAMGSGKVVITCLKCGNQFPAGSGTIKTTDEGGNVTFERQVPSKKKFGAGKVIVLIIPIIVLYYMSKGVVFLLNH